jgi:acylphosphatase
MKRLIAHVSGNIKRVGYSGIVETLARTLDLKGFIEFLPDGKAFIIAEGQKDDLARFVGAIHIENAKIVVKEILTDYREPTGEFNNFHKIGYSAEEQIHPDKNASETKTYNLLQAPDKIERLYPEIGTPNHRLQRAEPVLERQEESTVLCREDKLVPESCKSPQKVHRKLSLNK